MDNIAALIPSEQDLSLRRMKSGNPTRSTFLRHGAFQPSTYCAFAMWQSSCTCKVGQVQYMSCMSEADGDDVSSYVAACAFISGILRRTQPS